MQTNEVTRRSFKDVLSGAECYLGNLEELAGELDEVLVEDEEGQIVLTFDGVKSVVQVVWDKVKETVLECQGKEIVVKLPEGLVGNLLAATLQLLGFKL